MSGDSYALARRSARAAPARWLCKSSDVLCGKPGHDLRAHVHRTVGTGGVDHPAQSEQDRRLHLAELVVKIARDAVALLLLHLQHAREPNSIRSVALPGLGANTGQVPVEICADLMWTGYDLFRWRQFPNFAEMRKALEEILGDLGPMASKAQAKVAAGEVAGAKGFGAPAPADDDYDFDDFDDFDD